MPPLVNSVGRSRRPCTSGPYYRSSGPPCERRSTVSSRAWVRVRRRGKWQCHLMLPSSSSRPGP